MLKPYSWSSRDVLQNIITRNWTHELPHEFTSFLNNLGPMILGSTFYLDALTYCLLDFSLIEWFLNWSIWTCNFWISSHNSWVWTRTFEFQLVFLSIQLVVLSFQLVTRISSLVTRNWQLVFYQITILSHFIVRDVKILL